MCLALALAVTGFTASAADRREAPRQLRIGEVLSDSPLWAEWSRRFLSPSGRVVDTGAQGVSHSEGQGYGMLLAVAAGDRPAFDRIWAWTRAKLGVRADKLLAGRWDPVGNAVFDRNNATNGDILVAWALAEAADLWNAPDYAEAGAEIAADIKRLLVVDAPGVGPVLLPAHFGFTRPDQPDGPVVNLSYWIFPAFARLNQLAPDPEWERIRRSGLTIIDALQSPAPARVGDWTAVGDGKAAPARRLPATAGYAAARIPLYLAFSARDNAGRLSRFAPMFPPGARGLPIVDLSAGKTEDVATGRGYRALGALRACAVAGQPISREFYWLGQNDAYYPATLHMLAVIAALTSRNDCMDPVEVRHLQPRGPMRRLAGDLPRLQPVRAAVDLPRPAAVAAKAQISAIDSGDPTTGALLGVGAPIGALLGLIGFIAASRRSRTPAFVQDPTPPVLRERSPAPRHLPENPFCTARGERALEERLDIAAKASWQWQRTAAVACFRLPDYGDIVVAEGATAAQHVMSDLIAALSVGVRKSDAVTLVAPNEIVVCLSLIADEPDLASVGRRLTAALREARPMPGPEDNLFGLALYETAATGAQCLAQARTAFDALRLPRSTPKAAAEAP
ncbi:MAG: hypothetical protein KDJ25_16110 [Rhodoblastus sp.]|nr:hypothetical protein [Rhodoblastus sp.]